MSNLPRTTITCTNNDIVKGADVINASAMILTVVIDNTETTLKLFKQTPDEKLYVGNMGQLEFTSTGK